MRDPDIYDVGAHGAMLRDDVRLEAYVRALEATVERGSVVVDIGTGTGVLALVACSLGASRVYALESGDVIQLARQAVRDNGFDDRIELIQEVSTRVGLDERADLVVSDLRGVLPLFRRHLPSIVDARERFLAPGGRLLPRRDELWAAPVEASAVYDGLTDPWERSPRGVDLSAGHRLAIHRWCRIRAVPEQLVAAPRRWIGLDYERLVDADVGGDLTWRAERTASVHGLLIWFETRLTEDIGFSNAPGEPETIYGQAFFPWPRPLEIEGGDRIEASIHADLVGEDYVWRWDTRLLAPAGDVKSVFRQTSLQGMSLSPGRLRRREARHVPGLGNAGRAQLAALELMEGDLTLDEIAERLWRRFPEEFADRREALDRAADLAEEFGARRGHLGHRR